MVLRTFFDLFLILIKCLLVTVAIPVIPACLLDKNIRVQV